MVRLPLAALIAALGLVPQFSLAAEEWPLVVADDFESQGLNHWAASDPSAWKIVLDGDNHVLSQHRASRVSTPVRSPFNRALLSGVAVGDFQLDVDIRSTIKDYGHRDACLFFGFQDPAHFYYVHLGKQADDHANQIFIVNAAPRTKISTKSTAGTHWTDGWHHVRIRRTVASGLIEVYFDDMETPAMTATDKTFLSGPVGLGTFDDTADFDNFQLRGRPAP